MKVRKIKDNYDFLPIPVAIIDDNFQITYVNKSFNSEFEIEKNTCLNQSFFSFFKTDTDQSVIHKEMKKESIFQINNPKKLINININHLTASKEYIITFELPDLSICQKSNLEKELIELNDWQKAVLNASPYSIITTNTLGVITSINLAAERLLGYHAEELVGKHTPEIIHDKSETILKAKELADQLGISDEPSFYTYVRLSEKIGPTLTEWTYIKKNGDRFPVRLCVTPILNKENVVTGYVGIAEDITETKKLVDTIENQRLQMFETAKLTSLGEMANGMSHEINSPLLIIAGTANSLMRKIKTGSAEINNTQNDLKKIINSVDRIANIIIGLKEFSHVSTTEEFKSYNFEELLYDALQFCREKIKNHQIDLKLKCNRHMKIYCQKNQLIKVVIACIFNAIDAVDNSEEKWIKIETHKSNDHFNISITNSGPKISEKIEDKIMQPFFTTKDPGKGAGLGLSLSKGIVDSHGGQFFWDKKHPQTRFVISLPTVVTQKKIA